MLDIDTSILWNKFFHFIQITSSSCLEQKGQLTGRKDINYKISNSETDFHIVYKFSFFSDGECEVFMHPHCNYIAAF